MTMSISTNLPAHVYVEDDIYKAECVTVFDRYWQYLGAASQVSRPSSYIAASIAGRGVFVVRGQDGELRGFLNACRHRGAPLLDIGSGRCPRQIRCPYHLWSYDDRGALVEAPWFDNADSDTTNLSEYGLWPISVDVWRGLLFVAINPELTLLEQLGHTVTELADVPIDQYQAGGMEQLRFDANWKMYTDNFVEGYHIPGIHAKFYSMIDFEQFRTAPHDGIVCMTAPTRDDLFYQGRWYWMWPNWTLSLYPDGMSTSRINPLSALETELHYTFYFADISEQRAKQRTEIMAENVAVIREDFGICLSVHQNYLRGNYQPGPLSPRHEQGVVYFQQRWRESLGEHVSARARDGSVSINE